MRHSKLLSLTPYVTSLATLVLLACSAPTERKPVPPPADSTPIRTPAPATNPPPSTAPVAPAAAKRVHADHARGPMLWRVDANPPSWLIATIHAGTTLANAPRTVVEAVQKCRTLVLESDIENPDFAGAKPLMHSADSRLDKALGRTYFRRLVQFLGAPRSALVTMRPWAAVMSLAVKQMPAGEGLDKGLLRAFRQTGRAVTFLETTVAPLQILADLPDHKMLVELREGLDNPTATATEMRRVVAAFVAGDADKLRTLTWDTPQNRRFPGLNARFIGGRNGLWMTPLQPILKAGHACIAVGGGHLVGPGRLQELLRKRGWAVKRGL